jgi:methionyl-tRNA formyltransferase
MPLRLIFMGTPEFSVATLRAVAGAGHEIAAVYTQPPRPAGRRGLELKPSPVHLAAYELGLEVRTPKSLRGEAEQQAFAALQADAAVVVAYGLILPTAILEGTRLGAFNGHASLLPRWRGAAPIQRAVMAGDTETGMMIMKMDEGLDTGPVALTRKVAIGPDMTAGELHDELRDTGAELMVEALELLERGRLTLTPQPDEGVTYAGKISKDETRVDWSLPAQDVHNHIRGLSPFPGAWCEAEFAGRVERVKLLRSSIAAPPADQSNGAEVAPGTVLDPDLTVACGAGAVRLVELQRAGGKPLASAEFQRGAKLAAGDRLF